MANPRFNWQTIGTCLLTPSWHITDSGKFGGSCVGLAFWAMLTEFIRRWAREYDRYIIADATEQLMKEREKYPEEFSRNGFSGAFPIQQERSAARAPTSLMGRAIGSIFNPSFEPRQQSMRLRPTLVQQIVRSILYAIQFTSAYLIMLVIMSFNAYIFISVILGAMIGHFIASWDTLGALPYDATGHCATGGCAGEAPCGSPGSQLTVNECNRGPTKLPEAVPVTPAASGLPMEGEAAAINTRATAAMDDCCCAPRSSIG